MHAKPALGTPPSYLNDDESKPSLPTIGVSGGEKGARNGMGGFAGIGSLAGGFS